MNKKWIVLIVGILKECVMYIGKYNKDVNDEEIIGNDFVISKSFAVETLADKINFFHRSISVRSADQMVRDIIDRDHKEFEDYDFWCVYLPKVADLICKTNRGDLGKVTGLKMDKYLK